MPQQNAKQKQVDTKPSWFRRLTGSDIMSDSMKNNPKLAGHIASMEQQWPLLAMNVNRIGGPSILDKNAGLATGYSGKASLLNTIGLSSQVIDEDNLDPRQVIMHEMTHTSQPWWKRAAAPFSSKLTDKLEEEARASESKVKPRKGDINLPIDTKPIKLKPFMNRR